MLPLQIVLALHVDSSVAAVCLGLRDLGDLAGERGAFLKESAFGINDTRQGDGSCNQRSKSATTVSGSGHHYVSVSDAAGVRALFRSYLLSTTSVWLLVVLRIFSPKLETSSPHHDNACCALLSIAHDNGALVMLRTGVSYNTNSNRTYQPSTESRYS